VAALVELAQSPNEATRLAAIREALDRLLGKAPLAVDSSTSDAVVTNIQQLFLTAVQEANRRPDPRPIDVTPAPDARDGAIEW
jgi:hypothetical protein